MTTFNEFLERKKSSALVNECAQLLAERDVDPYVYIYESLKDFDPVLAEGFWDGVQNFAKNVGQGVKQFFGNVAQGAKAGYNQASDTIAGPVAKFQAAQRALNDLLSVLDPKKNPAFDGWRSSTGEGSLIDYIQKVKVALERDEKAMPQRTDTKVSQPYAKASEVEAQRKAAAAGQQPTRQSPIFGADNKPMVVPAAS